MLFAQKNKLTTEKLGFEKKDIDAVALNIEKGKRADIAPGVQNEKEQTAQKKDASETMQKTIITNLMSTEQSKNVVISRHSADFMV